MKAILEVKALVKKYADFFGDFSAGSEYRRLFKAHPDNTFLIKFSYWLSI